MSERHKTAAVVLFFAVATPALPLFVLHQPEDPWPFVAPLASLGAVFAYNLTQLVGHYSQPKLERKEMSAFTPLRVRWALVIGPAGMALGGIAWAVGQPGSADGSARVRDSEVGTWSLQLQSCAHPPGYDTVFIEEGARWIWVRDDGVTVGVTDHSGETKSAARATRDDCARFDVELYAQGAFDVAGEVHLTCELPSGGLLEADFELDECSKKHTITALDTLQDPDP